MKGQDELFLLIKSMDKNEKGYFRKFSKLHSSSREGNYLKLFDTLAAMDEYSDKKLREKLKGEKFLAQLRVTKFYLKKMIIRALRNYYEDRLPGLQSALSIADGHIMLHKKMNDSLPARFEKELTNALEMERFDAYTIWSSLYYNWLNTYGHGKKYSGRNLKLLATREEVIKKQLNYNAFIILSQEAFRLHVSGGEAPGENIINDMHKILQHPLFSSPNAAMSRTAAEHRDNILTLLYEATGQADKALDMLRTKVAQTSEKFTGTAAEVRVYMNAINALLGMLRKKDLDEMRSLLKKYEQVMQKYKNELAAPSRRHYEFGWLVHQMTYYYYRRDAPAQLKLVSNMKEQLKEHPQMRTQEEIVALTGEALALAELRQFDKALEVVNEMYNENYKMRSDLVLIAARLSIIIHIELGNFRLIEKLISRAAKQSKEIKRELPYQKELSSYFRQIAGKFNAGNRRDIKNNAQKFLEFLEAKVPDELDYIKHWLMEVVSG